MHGHIVYVKEGLPFAWDLSLENSSYSYLNFKLGLLHSVSYFFSLLRSPSSFLYTVFHYWGKKWLVDFDNGKTRLASFDRSNKNDSIDVKMDGSILEEKSSLKMLGLTFSSKLDWGSCIIFIAKTASKKIGGLIHFMKFLSP